MIVPAVLGFITYVFVGLILFVNYLIDLEFRGEEYEILNKHGKYRGWTLIILRAVFRSIGWPVWVFVKYINGMVRGK